MIVRKPHGFTSLFSPYSPGIILTEENTKYVRWTGTSVPLKALRKGLGETTLDQDYTAEPGRTLDAVYNVYLNGKPVSHVAYTKQKCGDPHEGYSVVGLYEIDYTESRIKGVPQFVLKPDGSGINIIEVKGIVTVEAKPTENMDMPETVCKSSREVGGYIYHEYDIAQKLTLEYDHVDPVTNISLFKIVSDRNGRWSGTWFFRDASYLPSPHVPGDMIVILTMHSIDGSGAGCHIAHLSMVNASMDCDCGLPVTQRSYMFQVGACSSDIMAKSICVILNDLIP